MLQDIAERVVAMHTIAQKHSKLYLDRAVLEPEDPHQGHLAKDFDTKSDNVSMVHGKNG